MIYLVTSLFKPYYFIQSNQYVSKPYEFDGKITSYNEFQRWGPNLMGPWPIRFGFPLELAIEQQHVQQIQQLDLDKLRGLVRFIL